MRRQMIEKDPLLEYSQSSAEWLALSPYDVIRRQNCKLHRYVQHEVYPSIRPPVSKCNPAQTMQSLVDAVRHDGCKANFNGEQHDLIAAWKQSPYKETLGYYGIGPEFRRPEAASFNQVIASCLKKSGALAVHTTKKSKISSTVNKQSEKKQNVNPYFSYVLNRESLRSKVNKMPAVQSNLKADHAFSWLHCPRKAETKKSLCKERTHVTLKTALDVEPRADSPKHALKSKYNYCEDQCGLPENKCTELEWQSYKQDPQASKEPLEVTATQESEPCDYDELYAELLSCFDAKPNKCAEFYAKCCGKKSKSDKDGAGGDGAGGDGGAGEGDSDDDDDGRDSGNRIPRPPDKPSKLDHDGHGDRKNKLDDDKDKKHKKIKDKDGDDDDDDDDDDKGDGKRDKNQDVDTGKKNKKNDDRKTPFKIPKEDDLVTQPPLSIDPSSGDGDEKIDSFPPIDPPPEESTPKVDENKQKRKKNEPRKKKIKRRNVKDKTKDCPCPVCECKQPEPDSPCMSEMKKQQKRRELQERHNILHRSTNAIPSSVIIVFVQILI
ncbi:uncharacterized protein LOC108597677 [Drosophila busckii]|uniref:uncharacterized protein LOC108597677 n=1 Tax=Drosophila busckii TaxID=30019 RepID=UPI00083F1CAA|nr:uncharacterized protein LOC108597677 [Drosophila busckii]